jgi:hypothetical protein
VWRWYRAREGWQDGVMPVAAWIAASVEAFSRSQVLLIYSKGPHGATD